MPLTYKDVGWPVLPVIASLVFFSLFSQAIIRISSSQSLYICYLKDSLYISLVDSSFFLSMFLICITMICFSCFVMAYQVTDISRFMVFMLMNALHQSIMNQVTGWMLWLSIHSRIFIDNVRRWRDRRTGFGSRVSWNVIVSTDAWLLVMSWDVPREGSPGVEPHWCWTACIRDIIIWCQTNSAPQRRRMGRC